MDELSYNVHAMKGLLIVLICFGGYEVWNERYSSDAWYIDLFFGMLKGFGWVVGIAFLIWSFFFLITA